MSMQPQSWLTTHFLKLFSFQVISISIHGSTTKLLVIFEIFLSLHLTNYNQFCCLLFSRLIIYLVLRLSFHIVSKLRYTQDHPIVTIFFPQMSIGVYWQRFI